MQSVVRNIYGSFHISTSKGTKQEAKAYNANDVLKWINHNMRNLESFPKHKNLKSKIDFSKSIHNQTLKSKKLNLTDFKKSQTFINWINSLVDPQLIKDYNHKQKKKFRRVKDFYELSTRDKTKSIADQLIVSLGDGESFKEIKDWFITESGKSFWYNYHQDLINFLREKVPTFKIYNSTLHLDETTPHVHIVGVTLKKRSNKYGLPIQIKNSKFLDTPDDLVHFHNQLREFNNTKAFQLTQALVNEDENNPYFFRVPKEKKGDDLKRFDTLEIKNLINKIENLKKSQTFKDLEKLKTWIEKQIHQEIDPDDPQLQFLEFEKHFWKHLLNNFIQTTNNQHLAYTIDQEFKKFQANPFNYFKRQNQAQNYQNPTNKKGFGL